MTGLTLMEWARRGMERRRVMRQGRKVRILSHGCLTMDEETTTGRVLTLRTRCGESWENFLGHFRVTFSVAPLRHKSWRNQTVRSWTLGKAGTKASGGGQLARTPLVICSIQFYT